jgi:UDP-4-amino-4-deoxy-L-arabinose formyltransferase/UDP-glucuronic acid dehydrogenase (UDP-4-keto-hexauronic acid decarboxylating)
MNVLLVAEESAGAQTLKALAQGGHRVVGVLTSPPKNTNSGPGIWNLAAQLGYQVWPAHIVKDPAFAERMRSDNIDILLNVHSLHIICKEVLSAPRLGSFNMHPGPLPRYAGLNAVSWAIYRGEDTHGVTIHKMLPAIDAGPIVYQSLFPIDAKDTGLSLSLKCVRKGIPLLLQLVKTASHDPAAIPLVSQDLSKREYFGKGVPQNGKLSWARRAREIMNFVRACDYLPFRSPWGQPRTRAGNQEIGVVRASLVCQPCKSPPGTIGKKKGQGVQVACADEWLSISRLALNGLYVNAVDILATAIRLTEGV